jgi:hypothetical protein
MLGGMMRTRVLIILSVVVACGGRDEPSWYAVQLASARVPSSSSLLSRVVNRSFTPDLIDQFAVAASRSLRQTPDRAELTGIVTEFGQLWDSTGAIIPSAVTKYSRRIATVPRSAVRQWASLTATDQLSAAFSLAALGGLWFGESFSEPAFRRLVARARRS